MCLFFVVLYDEHNDVDPLQVQITSWHFLMVKFCPFLTIMLFSTMPVLE